MERLQRAVAVVLGLGLAACGEPVPEGSGPSRVTVASVEAVSLPLSVHYRARAQAAHELPLTAPRSGRVSEVALEPGAPVREGDPVARIDPGGQEEALARARSELPERQEALDRALEDFRSARSRLDDGTVSSREFDRITRAEEERRREVNELRATVETAQRELARATARAPADGFLVELTVREGTRVRAGSRLGRVALLDPAVVSFSVPARDWNELWAPRFAATREGVPVKLRLVLSSGAVHPQPGRLETADLPESATDAALSLRASFPNPELRVAPDDDLVVVVEARAPVQAHLVPESALRGLEDEPHVLIVGADGRVERRLVRLGPHRGGGRVVYDGVVAGERVVVTGPADLAPGARVELAPLEETTADEAARPVRRGPPGAG